jgi:hypothetical protein
VADENIDGKSKSHWGAGGFRWQEMIEKAIHEIITNAAYPNAVALLALLPATKIATGTNHDKELPYCSINRESNSAEYRSNVGGQRRYLVRFQVWHDVHAAGLAISEAIQNLFENEDFSTLESDLIQTRHENDFAIQEEDGTWQFVIDIQVIGTPKG